MRFGWHRTMVILVDQTISLNLTDYSIGNIFWESVGSEKSRFGLDDSNSYYTLLVLVCEGIKC